MRAFHEIASEYCDWFEHRVKHRKLAVWLPCILAELIHAGFRLPAFNASKVPSQDFQPRDCRSKKDRSLHLPFRHYREVFDALDLTAEPVTAGLVDDLLDIYLDLARGFQIANERSPEDGVRHWSLLFRVHWGEHATGALRALYSFYRHK